MKVHDTNDPGCRRKSTINLAGFLARSSANGPGIRSVVWVQGCPLNCEGCFNPQFLPFTPAQQVTPSALAERICALEPVEGVTFSGGEPLMYAEPLIELLDECGKRGIHRAVDTAGHVGSEILLDVARRTDLFLYDLKLMDSDLHEQWTGVKNEKILSNLSMLAASGAKIIVRVPLVAGVNDHEGNIRQTAEFISALPGEKMEVHLLPYHAIARHKYAKLGKHETFNELEEPGAESLQNVIGWFAEYGIRSQVGG